MDYLIENTKYPDIINDARKEPSLEAQIVRICDKIAYLISDIEDGFIVDAISISELKDKKFKELFCSLKKEPFDLSEHRSYLRCREDIIKKLLNDCIKKYRDKKKVDIDKFKGSMDFTWTKIQERIIFKNYYVKNSYEKGKLITSCLFCQYLRDPELIGLQSFRYKYHDQSESYINNDAANKVSYYNRIKRIYNFANTRDVSIELCQWLEIDNCSGSNVEQIFERNIVDVICVKDWVASLSDRYAEKCYHEHVNCWKSKEKWNRLNSLSGEVGPS